jgi:hypothetical protein
MRKLVASAGVGASLLVLTSAALADGYSAPRGYERTFSWTGFYIGAQGGAGWGTSDDNLTAIEICTGGQCTGVIPFAPKGTGAGQLRHQRIPWGRDHRFQLADRAGGTWCGS